MVVGRGMALLGGSTLVGPGLALLRSLYFIGRLRVGMKNQMEAGLRGEAVCNEKSYYSISAVSRFGWLPFSKASRTSWSSTPKALLGN